MQRAERWIIHLDLDAFYASVEELLRPEYRGQPIIVGGRPEGRGVVSSASYAARAYGVRSAMPSARALRLCPSAVLLPPRHRVYSEYSQRVMAIPREYTPLFEQISVDEAFLDVTGCERLWGKPPEIAAQIQRRVLDECGLPCSLGVATSRLVAKIACSSGKPRGLTVVPSGEEQSFLAPFPIESLWGVGEITGERLRGRGIRVIGDLVSWSREALEGAFGESAGWLYDAARGIDRGELRTEHAHKSISQERTFDVDVDDGETLRRNLLSMSEHVAATLRRRHLVTQTVRVKLRRPDFTTLVRQTRLEQPTDQGQVIYGHVRALFEKEWQPGHALRLLGVGVTNLLEESGYQLGLFEHEDERNARLNQALDEIRSRFGKKAIQRASLMRRHAPPDDSAPTAPREADHQSDN